MPKIAATLAAALLLVACAQRQPTVTGGPPLAGSPEETEAPPETPDSAGSSTCETVNGGNPSNFPRFTEVELESDDGVDRITFGFEPDQGAPRKAPWHHISFVDELVTDGEGRPVEVEGNAYLLVSFQAIGVDLSGEEPVEVYTGPKEFSPGYGTLKEAVHMGDFEGQVSWGLGLAERTCFVLEARQDHITLEFAQA
ncbi:MAG: AMIN-like domain-containing (lipo)protein [Actinomycetota bacterium]